LIAQKISIASKIDLRITAMSKEKKKKEPEKTLKEKRKEKKQKKSGKNISDL
jgi:RNA processing factor Prp31